MKVSPRTVAYTNYYLFQNRNLPKPYNIPPSAEDVTYPKPEIKVFYFIMCNTKMENQYIFLRTSSDEIDNLIEGDSEIREGNEKHYFYPLYLYELLLQRKDINIEFNKPNNIGIKEHNYEWTREFHTLFSQIVRELGEVCDNKTCPKMTAEPDMEYKCMNHGKQNPNCCAIDYCLHTYILDVFIVLLYYE
jgi:hypothetical protein